MSPFLHGPIAWSALGLASIPIIIHLINRRRLRRLDWAAMEFLLIALRKNRRRIRLEQLILLLLRVVLMALIALFLARPLLSDRGLGWLASTLTSEERIFVIDDSLSMGQTQADRSRLSRATAALSDSLRRLAERSSRDRVTILRTSRPDSPLVRGVFVDRDRAAAVSRTLKSLSVTSTRMKPGDAIESLAEHRAAAATGSPRRPRSISILTDMRAADWTDGGGKANASLAAAFERVASNDEATTRIIVLDVGSQDIANVAIQGIDIGGGRPTVDLRADVRVEVVNFGDKPVRDLRVQVSYGTVSEGKASATMSQPAAIQQLGPGETAVASIACTFRMPGQYWLTADVGGSGDTLGADNRSSIVIDVVESTELLLVNGEPSSERFEGETDYLAAALHPPGDASSGFTPVIAVEDNLPRGDLSRFGAVILANAYTLPDDFLGRLGRYVRDGGTLVVFLGDQIDPVVYARHMGDAEGRDDAHPARGILPAKIAALVDHGGTPVGMVPSYEHRYFRFLKGEGERYMPEVSFSTYFRLEPLPEAQVIARFDDGDDSPAIVEGGAGEGRVILFASTADAEWHDWPPHVTYLPVLEVMMQHVGRSRRRQPVYAAGSRIEIPVDIAVYDASEIRLRGPDYPKTPERVLIASPEEEDAASYQIAIEDTFQSGLSFLSLKTRSGGEETRGLAVRSEPRESDLHRIRPDELRALYPDVPLTVVRDASRFSETGRGHFEISDLLIAAFIALLFVEGALACWFAHHRAH